MRCHVCAFWVCLISVLTKQQSLIESKSKLSISCINSSYHFQYLPLAHWWGRCFDWVPVRSFSLSPFVSHPFLCSAMHGHWRANSFEHSYRETYHQISQSCWEVVIDCDWTHLINYLSFYCRITNIKTARDMTSNQIHFRNFPSHVNWFIASTESVWSL